MARYAIAVHGGCGRWPATASARALRGVREAVATARRLLAEGGSALDAVCAAVAVLEDNPLFNAGTGGVLNRDGVAEMDASVMVGDALRCGGVAAIQRVQHPVLVARRVMEDTPHVLLAGAGALAFARACGFADYDPATRSARERHSKSPGTVGAVARNARGVFAAATSTGGVHRKLPGRVGDSPIPGAGNYATRFGAASATGTGELMMRTLAAKSLCDLLGSGRSAQAAATLVVRRLGVGEGQSGAFIALDRASRVGVAMQGGRMPHAWCVEGDARISARISSAGRE